MNRFIKTCFALLLAVNLCGIGVGLVIQAGLGSDSLTIFQEGLSAFFHISIGDSARIFVVLTIGLALLISRKDIGWVTIAYGLIVSYPIDFYNNLIAGFNLAEMSFIVRLLCVCIGQLAFIITYSLLIRYRNGMGQIDAIAYGIERMTKVPFKIVRTGIDVVFLIIGIMLGGVIGVGSIITMFTTGYGIDFCLKIMDKFHIN